MILTAAVHAIVITVAAAVLFAAAVIAAALLRPDYGRHRLDGEKTAGWFRSLRTDTPAQPAVNAGQEPGLDLIREGPVPATPAPPDAARAGQALGAAPQSAPTVGAATLPQPEAAPPVAAGSSPGLGQPRRQSWVAYDARPTWEVLTDGDDPAAFEHASRRVTGTAFRPGIRETGALPALVRPAARRSFERTDRWWEP